MDTILDQYDEQIKRLTESPERIATEWGGAVGLFKFAENPDSRCSDAGCLTQIRMNPDSYGVYKNRVLLKEVTEEIANDTRIPSDNKLITVEHLPVFAEWQRKLDKILNE